MPPDRWSSVSKTAQSLEYVMKWVRLEGSSQVCIGRCGREKRDHSRPAPPPVALSLVVLALRATGGMRGLLVAARSLGGWPYGAQHMAGLSP